MSGICLVLRFTSFCLETLSRVISGAETLHHSCILMAFIRFVIGKQFYSYLMIVNKITKPLYFEWIFS